MAKVTAPILSGRARGQIGSTQVYASWRGVQYARSYVVPRNPQTAAQQSRRDIFSAISDLWKRLGTIAVGPWNSATIGRPLTNRNLIIQKNLQPMVGETDRQAWTGSPGSFGGVAGTSLAAVGGVGSGTIDATLSVPAAPTGWTILAVEGFAMQDGLPQDFVPAPIAEAEDASPSAGGDNVVPFTGLTANTLHVVTCWPVWTKPNGQVAYGASLTTTATSTA